MAECGGQLNSALLASDLMDQMEIFTAPVFCGETAKPSFVTTHALAPLVLSGSHQHGHDIQLSLRRGA